MSALDSKEQWETADAALDAWRAQRDPRLFGHALGIDPYGLRDFVAADAEHMTAGLLADLDLDAEKWPRIVALAATAKFLGVELGLWLASTPEGRAFLEPSS